MQKEYKCLTIFVLREPSLSGLCVVLLFLLTVWECKHGLKDFKKETCWIINLLLAILVCSLATDSSPVVFIQHAAKIQRRERRVPRKGALGEAAPPPRARASPFAACYMKTTGDESGLAIHFYWSFVFCLPYSFDKNIVQE